MLKDIENFFYNWLYIDLKGDRTKAIISLREALLRFAVAFSKQNSIV